MKCYNDELKEVIDDCSGWDTEWKALKEAFDRGIEYQIKLSQKSKKVK